MNDPLTRDYRPPFRSLGRRHHPKRLADGAVARLAPCRVRHLFGGDPSGFHGHGKLLVVAVVLVGIRSAHAGELALVTATTVTITAWPARLARNGATGRLPVGRVRRSTRPQLSHRRRRWAPACPRESPDVR